MNLDPKLRDNTITAFYEAVLQPEQWETGLRYFSEVMHAKGACLVFGDLNSPSANIAHFIEHPAEAIRDYNTYFHALDPLVEKARNAPAGTWLNDWRDTSGSSLTRGAFYNDFMRRYDTHASTAALLLHDGSVAASISAQRALGQEPFDHHDQERGQSVLIHIQRAVRLHKKMHQMGMEACLAQASLDHIAAPVFITDASGHVRIANRAAEALCSAGIIFKVHAGKLAARENAEALQQAIATAACTANPRPAGMRFGEGSGDGQLHVIITPLTEHVAARFGKAEPSAMVIVHRQGRTRLSLDYLLQCLFGMTPAEARVARLMTDGFTPAELAQHLGVSIFTIRTHVKAVHVKTRLSRQGDICKLLGQLTLI